MLLWDIAAEKRNPTPDPFETVRRPPAGDKLLTELDADFEELLKKEKDPRPLREAALHFYRTELEGRGWDYCEAVAILRRTRSKAGIPLLLRYTVEHGALSNGYHMTPEYADTLTILSGADVTDPYRYVADRVMPVRDAVAALVETWWKPNKETLSTDLGAMSPEQLGRVVRRLLKKSQWNFRDYESYGAAQRVTGLLAAAVKPPREEHRTWWEDELHPAMTPLLLALAGYEEHPAPAAGRWENHAVPYAAVPLLAALHKKGMAPALDKLAEDGRQNAAIRLTCLLALRGAGEDLKTPAVLSILRTEKKLERRLVAIAALQWSTNAKAAVPRLLELLDDPNLHVRGAAALALRGFRPPAAVPKLKAILDDPRAALFAADLLHFLGEIGTREAQQVLADSLKESLRGGAKGRHLYFALGAFGAATGRQWTAPGAHDEEYYRDAARKALAWWGDPNR